MKLQYLKPCINVINISDRHELLAASGTAGNATMDMYEDYTDAPALSKKYQGLWDE